MENLKKKIQIIINLYTSKNYSKAEIFCRKLMKSYSSNIFLYNILGLILFEQKRINEAIECYEKGIKIKPDYAEIYNNLGTAYKIKKNYTEAENCYKKSIILNSKLPETQNNLANLYLEINKYQEAISGFKKAIDINKDFFLAHYNLGIAYKNLGKFDEAKKYLNATIKLNKYFCAAHRALSQITKYTRSDMHFALLKKIYRDTKIGVTAKIELAFALGKASEDIKDFSQAIEYFKKGNELHRDNLFFSIKNERKEFSYIKKIFNQNFFEKFKLSGSSDSTPIFILGMPRSGTTLVEQILSSHSKVFGGDELIFLTDLIEKHFNYNSSINFFKNLINIDNENLKQIAQEYVNNLKSISNNSEKVTDKLPINFKWIGLIKLILPNSKIIHCIRNPKDNCLSIFKNYFTNTELNYAYNFDEISAYYNLYSNLMSHWKNTLPKFIFDIKYEKIINDPERQIRGLLNACDLNWEKDCIKFYNNKRPIKTASDTQVRKKIYKSSINSWKNYEKYIKKSVKKLYN